MFVLDGRYPVVSRDRLDMISAEGEGKYESYSKKKKEGKKDRFNDSKLDRKREG